MANVTSLLTSLCKNFKDSASTSNSGTLPSQTVTNPRLQINDITTKSGKTLEGPSTPLVPTLVVSIPSKEPEQNPETSTKKVQNPNSESTAQVLPPEEEDSIFMEIPKPKAKKTVNVETQDLNSPKPTSYQSKLPYPERMKQNWLGALTPTRMTLELANHSITHPMGKAKDVVVRVDGFTFLADFVVVNFEPDPRVPIILGRPFLRIAKALIDLYEETLTLRIGKEELVYYADKSKKNKDKQFTSDSTFEEFINEFTLPNSLPPGNDVSIHKKDIHEETFSNPLFEFDDNFKSSDVNPLFEENDKDVEIKSSSSFTLTSPEEISSSNPTSPTLTGEKVCSWKTPMFFSLIRFVWRMMTQIAIRKKIICLLAMFLNKKPKPLSQEVEEIKEKEDEVSSDVPINTIAMPIRITFDNPIDFNHFSKPTDFKKDLAVVLDSTKSSILPPPLLDSDSPFTAELSASITLNSLRNEDKVFKPGILVYHAIHDKNLVTLEENLKENISSGTLLVFKEPSFLLPPPEPPDECLNFEPILVMKNVVLNEDFYQSKKTLPLNVEDVNSFTFVIWTFLPYFTYTEESPLIFSFRSENFVFDPDIVTFHKPVAFSMEVSCSKCCSP
ncbi:reverse transcriptase domain-containing protein [Tanacetum coccineum]